MKEQDALAWIAEIFEESSGRISAATRRDDIPGWDSLGTLSLIAAFDERFDIHMSEQDIEALQSVSDIFAILQRHGALEA